LWRTPAATLFFFEKKVIERRDYGGELTMARAPDRTAFLRNSQIAELLALAADEAKMPLQKALRRASRKAFLWPEEAALILKQGRSLIELPAVGPHLNRLIRAWIENPPTVSRPPQIRKGFFTRPEVRDELTERPAWTSSIKGDLQMHTQWSDGGGTVEDMARAAAERGYEYIAITDHSKGLKIAGGITEEQLAAQGEEIERVNDTMRAENLGVTVLRSIELNLDPRGAGDMDSRSLTALDVVLGCFHSALRKKEDQTERYVAALRNPDIQILGHPRGRIYNFRLGLAADWERVFGVAAELDKAVEIDAYPDRQDLSLDLVKLAKKARSRISLGTDAHDPAQLRFMDYALASAAKAGVPRDRILNFMSVDELRSWAASLRSARNKL
jgi:histidinol phosphatase-like PHP family hydrolase